MPSASSATNICSTCKFPDKPPGAAGSIAINSDFDKQGKAVDIYEIRVSIEP